MAVSSPCSDKLSWSETGITVVPLSGIVEIDLNPVMVGRPGEGNLAVDAVVLVQDNGEDLEESTGP